MAWFKSPDQIGGWKTAQENQSDNMLRLEDILSGIPALGDFSATDFFPPDFFTGGTVGGGFSSGFSSGFAVAVALPDSGLNHGWITNPIDYQVNDSHAQFYAVGLMPIGLDTTDRAIIGVKPYG